MQIHTELSYHYLHFTGKKSDRETHPSEFSNSNGWDSTLEIFILPYLCLDLISLRDSVPSLKTGMPVFTWWHCLTDIFINVSRNSDTTAVGARIWEHRENSFCPRKKKSRAAREYRREN